MGKNVSIKTKVSEFMARDRRGGVRSISRGRMTLDNQGQAASNPRLLELAISLEKRLASAETLSDCALAFEAMTLKAATYTISPPPVLALGSSERNYSDFFENRLRGCLWVYGSSGQHCGTIKGMSSDDLPEEMDDYALVLLSASDQDRVSQADVEAYRDRLPPEYPSSKEYYEEIFDTKTYGYKECWALNVLLVRWLDGESVAERVAVGQIHADAWVRMHPQQKAIVLV